MLGTMTPLHEELYGFHHDRTQLTFQKLGPHTITTVTRFGYQQSHSSLRLTMIASAYDFSLYPLFDVVGPAL